jgi:hypothetical protein
MKKYLFFLVLSVVISGCTNKNPEHFYVSGEFQAWTVFHRGSYWIYENDSTLVKDSVFLRYDPIIVDVPSDPSTYPSTAESIRLLFASAIYTYSETKVDFSGIESFQMVFKNDSLFYPYGLVAASSDNFELSSPGNNYRTLSVDSVYTIGQLRFTNVVETECTGGLSPVKYTFWFAKGIGLIKVTYENGFTKGSWSWSIVRFHVV